MMTQLQHVIFISANARLKYFDSTYSCYHANRRGNPGNSFIPLSIAI